jgi:hypothetical protein
MYKNLLISLFSMSYFFIFLCSSAGADNKDLPAITERFNQSNELAGTLFFDIYKEFGSEIRLFSVLEACDKKELARAFTPNFDTITLFMAKKFGETSGNLKFSDSRAAFDAILSAQTYLQGYIVGYKEAAKTFTSPGLCKAAEVMAGERLLQRNQSNKHDE